MPQFNSSQVSNDQTKSNVNTGITNAILNNTNQVTPWGSLNYAQTGGQYDYNGNFIPSFTATQTLSPQQQGILNQSQALQSQGLGIAGDVLNRVQGAVSSPIDFNGLPTLPTFNVPDQTKFQGDAYNALMARQNQQFGLQDQALQTQLANQGISSGSAAYNNAYIPLNQSRVDASNQATLNASQLAGQNINQALSIDNQGFNEALTGRQQGIQERMMQRNQPLLDYQALLGISGGVTQPNWVQGVPNQVQPTDVTGPAVAGYQGQVNAYNQGVATNNAMMGGLFGLGGSVLGGLARAPGVQKFMGIGG